MHGFRNECRMSCLGFSSFWLALARRSATVPPKGENVDHFGAFDRLGETDDPLGERNGRAPHTLMIIRCV